MGHGSIVTVSRGFETYDGRRVYSACVCMVMNKKTTLDDLISAAMAVEAVLTAFRFVLFRDLGGKDKPGLRGMST